MKRSSLFVWLGLLFLLIMVVIPVAATPVISKVSPLSGSIGSSYTITITGSGFDSVNKVLLYRCGSKYGTSGSVTGTNLQVTPTKITAKIDLSGTSVVSGDYDVLIYSDEGVNYQLAGFNVYGGSTPKPTGTTTATATTTTVKTTKTTTTATTTTTYSGKNSVYFETNPSGAEISLNGQHIGTSTFTYYTDKDGTFSVVARKSGYEDYEDKVTIREGSRVRFYAKLVPLVSPTVTVTTNATPSVSPSSPSESPSSEPANATPTIRKSTLKIPTPLGTDPPLPEESPANPAIALGAAGIAIAVVLLRRQ